MHLTLNTIAAFFFLTIIRDRDASFNCFAKIKTFFITFSAFKLILAKAVDRFSAVFSVFAKSFI
jgi:hypothetical protein